MLPLLLPIISALAPILLPDIVKAVTGDSPVAQKVGEAAVAVVSQVTGLPIASPADAQVAVAAVQADPAKLADLYRIQGEQVLQLLTLDNQDRADARSQTVALAQASSRIAWGAPLVSLVVLITFGVVLYRVLSAPAGQADPNASLMLGALTTMATAVVSYWVGSSAGSAAKDKLLRGR
ncbi:MAG: hypothetical protein ACLGJC_21345 [Alphaproteobacteria bacterium]